MILCDREVLQVLRGIQTLRGEYNELSPETKALAVKCIRHLKGVYPNADLYVNPYGHTLTYRKEQRERQHDQP